MIPFDFNYYKPDTVDELLACVSSLKTERESFVYYAGGTELVTAFRKNKISTKNVIDLKGIQEICQIIVSEDFVTIGACASLNDLIECEALSPLHLILDKIADHTVRNALTIGGNLMGRLPYREAVMPLLSLDAEVVYYHEGSRVTEKLGKVFDKRMKLPADSCLYQIIVPKVPIKWQYQTRITESVTVDYPILHLHGMGVESRITVALSGYSSFPVHVVLDIKDVENQTHLKMTLLEHFEKLVKADDRSGEAYRRHLLSLAIDEMLKEVSLC